MHTHAQITTRCRSQFISIMILLFYIFIYKFESEKKNEHVIVHARSVSVTSSGYLKRISAPFTHCCCCCFQTHRKRASRCACCFVLLLFLYLYLYYLWYRSFIEYLCGPLHLCLCAAPSRYAHVPTSIVFAHQSNPIPSIPSIHCCCCSNLPSSRHQYHRPLNENGFNGGHLPASSSSQWRQQ